MDEVEVTLYGPSQQKRTFLKKDDIWLANEHGLQVLLKELQSFLYVSHPATNNVSVLDTSTNPPKVVATVPVGTEPRELVVSPDKARVYVVNRSSQTISVIDTTVTPPTVVDTVPVGAQAFSIAISPDGKRAFVGCGPYDGGSIKIVDLTTTPPTVGPPVAVPGLLQEGHAITGLAVTPDGNRLFVTGGPTINNNDSVSVFNISNPVPLPDATVEGYHDGSEFVCINPEGTRVFVSFYHGGLNVFDAMANPPLRVAVTGSGEVNGAALSPDGTRLLMGHADMNMYVLWNTAALPPNALAQFQLHELAGNPNHPPGRMVFSQDGTRLYMVSRIDDSTGTGSHTPGLVVFDMTANPPSIVNTVLFGGKADDVGI